jgi:hypothetical protein
MMLGRQRRPEQDQAQRQPRAAGEELSGAPLNKSNFHGIDAKNAGDFVCHGSLPALVVLDVLIDTR